MYIDMHIQISIHLTNQANVTHNVMLLVETCKMHPASIPRIVSHTKLFINESLCVIRYHWLPGNITHTIVQ